MEVLVLIMFRMSSWLPCGTPRMIERTSAGRLKLRLGHIGAFGELPNEDKMLNVSLEDLHETGVIGKDLDIEIISIPGCGESFQGVAVAAEMYYKQQMRAFIGPYCPSGLIFQISLLNWKSSEHRSLF
ncbi:unnamed protein product [Gongylonema pulchrum]|uniref:ANF_receptor domain-containing protein n=1 Tax=Gongylonema pulchrum TaxID=637853 RepID=A0A183D1Y1_9BILA|nr:unnamed protein product [Gongylonema pulchrum]